MWRVASGCAIGAALALGLCVLVPALLGFQRYVITSGSMSGTYDRGSLVLDEVVPVGDLRVGDVITYTPPAGFTGVDVISYRATDGIDRDACGRRPGGDVHLRPPAPGPP